jgi:hypothetical protein
MRRWPIVNSLKTWRLELWLEFFIFLKSSEMAAPRLPQLSSASSPWGPPSEVPESLRFHEVPYAPFSKGDKLGKVADWNTDSKDGKDQKRQPYGRSFRDPYHAYGASAASFFTIQDAENVQSFEVVDSASKAAPKPRGGAQNAVLRTRGGRGGASQAGQRGGMASGTGSGGRQFGGRPQDRWAGRVDLSAVAGEIGKSLPRTRSRLSLLKATGSLFKELASTSLSSCRSRAAKVKILPHTVKCFITTVPLINSR